MAARLCTELGLVGFWHNNQKVPPQHGCLYRNRQKSALVERRRNATTATNAPEGMDGERYRCKKCGHSYYLDYEEMK